MTAPLSDVVSIAITATTVNPTQAGFNTPMIISHTATWSERVRSYSTIAGVGSDFATTTPEYKAAAKIFAQNPSLNLVKIGRAALPPTQRWAVTPVALDSHKYSMSFNGTTVNFTSDTSGTVTEIIAGLKTAIDLLSLAITVSDQTTYMRIVANVAGAWFRVGTIVDGSPQQDPNLGLVEDHADPGIATDLAAILVADSAWYSLITTFNSKAYVDAAAAWCETNKRLYVVQTQDSPCINTTLSGTDDVMESTRGNSLTHTAVIYSEANDDFADAGWCGAKLVGTPGTNTWKFANISGVTAGNYTTTQRSNIKAKNGNFYEEIAGVAITQNGTVAGGGFIDFTIYIDYLQARLAERIFGLLAASAKIAYTDAGIALIAAEVRAQLQTDEARGALAPGWTVTVPLAANVSSADRASRTLNGVSFAAQYAGAIHLVNIAGVVLP